MLESALEPAGIQAARISGLWWYMFWTSAVVWALVLVALFWAVQRARRRDGLPPAGGERDMRRAVGAASGLTILVLLGTLVYSVFTGNALASQPRDTALRITVTGHQWWWKIQYEDSVPSHTLITGNEMHVPVGEPIQVIGKSADVIHSLWAPNLFGKKDLIPGRATQLWFQVDTPGVYRGQCAEFCGHQHAKMAIVIVAEPRAKFDTWYRHQLQPAAPPSSSGAVAGEQVFMSRGCPLCHTVAGTNAQASIGPPLTHIASALTLAAGTIRNTRSNLAGWIIDPQLIKPGVRMPPHQLPPSELQSLLDYMEGLK